VLERFQLFSASHGSPLRPHLACEISALGVIAARQSGTVESAMTAFAALRPGDVTPGLKPPSFGDPAAVVKALKSALDQVSGRDRQITLVVPDASVRVLLLDFDTLPSRAQEALPIVRFRLRKLVPFEVEDAAISFQVMSRLVDDVRVLVTIMPAAVRTEYETAVREAGYEPGVVLPSTLAAVAALHTEDASLVVNMNGHTVTTAITRANELLLHRTIDLPSDPANHPADFQQTVSVAIAYFEDTLKSTPPALLFVGPGGAHNLGRFVGDYSIPIRDLVETPATGLASTIPQGLFAPVAGALAS
jgi:type IV pilus assembly protein PilM